MISNNASLKEKLSFTKTQSTQAVHYGYQNKRQKKLQKHMVYKAKILFLSLQKGKLKNILYNPGYRLWENIFLHLFTSTTLHQYPQLMQGCPHFRT